MLAVMYIENLPSSQSDGKLMKSRSILYKKKKIKRGRKTLSLARGIVCYLQSRAMATVYMMLCGEKEAEMC